jgi:3-oxoadipate enol-lactonase
MLIETFIDVEGARLFYRLEGSGPTLVFIHGFSFDQRMWAAQQEAFRAHYRVISVDMRGFGRSEATSARPGSFTDDLKSVLTECGVEQAVLIGHSAGAIVACDFAIHHPNQVKALVLVNAAVANFPWSKEFLAEWSGYQSLAAVDMVAARTAWLSSDIFRGVLRKPELAGIVKEMVADYSGWHWIEGIAVGKSQTTHQQLEQLKHPALIIVGAEDNDDFHQCGQMLDTALCNGRRIDLEHSGHLSNLEQADNFNQQLLTFLQELELW